MAARHRHRGSIEQLPSGSYRAVVYAGTDPLTGKPKYLRETHKSRDAAEVALTRLQGQVDEDRHPKTDITVGRAIEQWLDVSTLEDTTREHYDDLILDESGLGRLKKAAINFAAGLASGRWDDPEVVASQLSGHGLRAADLGGYLREYVPAR